MKSQILIRLLAVLVLLAACKGKSSYATSADSASSSIVTSKQIGAKTDTTDNGAKLVKTANLHFKVKNVQQTSEHIAALTANYNGMVVHHLMGSTSEHSEDIRVSKDSLMRLTVFNTNAEMTVKIPPAKMVDFVNQVARMGIFVNNLRMDINDKSLDYLSTRLKIKNRTELSSKENNGKTVDEQLAYNDHIIDQVISNRAINDSVKTSTITLSFYESSVINREMIANDDLSAYNPSFFKRLGMSLENGWEILDDIIIGLANFWVLLPTGLIIWYLVRSYKTKKNIGLAKLD